VIQLLKSISDRYAPSRILSFNFTHVFKTLQLIEKEGYASRNLLIDELLLGEGSIKTLIKHLKMEKIISTSNKGTNMTDKGKNLLLELNKYICSETKVPKCSISIGKYNHAVLLRNLRFAIKHGVEQRDVAIKMGAKGATTLIYNNGNFFMAGTKINALKEEKAIEKILKDNLNPVDDDIVVIGSDDNNYLTAELASKAAALNIIEDHRDENHGNLAGLNKIANQN